jgi:hypothetical protein
MEQAVRASVEEVFFGLAGIGLAAPRADVMVEGVR